MHRPPCLSVVVMTLKDYRNVAYGTYIYLLRIIKYSSKNIHMFPKEQCLPDIGFEEPTPVGVTWIHGECMTVVLWLGGPIVTLWTWTPCRVITWVQAYCRPKKKTRTCCVIFWTTYVRDYNYWSGAMVACVGLMVMTCKARRNGSEARAASVQDPGWLLITVY